MPPGRLWKPSGAGPLCAWPARAPEPFARVTGYSVPMIEVPMTEDQFAAATRRLADNGIQLAGREGTLTKDGVTARYAFDGVKLAIEIVDRPFLLPLSMIEGRLKAYLEQSLAAGPASA